MPPRRSRVRARVVPAIGAGSWLAAGNRFTKLRRVEPIPVEQYTQVMQGIRLTGGQVSAQIPPSGNLTLTVGPQGLGTVWYPTQVTLSTTTGALDTSTALVYLGIGGVPTQLVATLYSGNGTAGLVLPPMTPGEFLITSWSAGHNGDTASVNILGTMDALTTG